jgi:hypothetical protein
MKSLLFVMGLSIFLSSQASGQNESPPFLRAFSERDATIKIKHFGATEENPADAFDAAIALEIACRKSGKEVPVDCPMSPEVMDSSENHQALFRKNSKGRLAPIVNGEKEELFNLEGLGVRGTLAARRRIKSVGSYGSQSSEDSIGPKGELHQ